MKIVCVGGGPAGLYLALLAKLRSPAHDITVLERNAPGATHGWGVTFGEDFLDDLYRCDPDSARAVRGAALLWADQVVRIGDARPVHLGGKYGFSMGRAALLDILAARALALGVRVEFDTEAAADLSADLVVAADGAGSGLRSHHVEHFGTTLESGRNRYMWLGTTKVFAAFTFAFEHTSAGWIWFYTYPSSGGTSTCIVECTAATWAGLGFGTLDPAVGLEKLEQIFARTLEGHRLLVPPAPSTAGTPSGHTTSSEPPGTARWLNFREVRNRTWRRDNLVLIGDAAHTTHFSIGSGTVLAVQDAIALAEALPGTAAGLPAALAAYDQGRRAALEPVQAAARRSMTWFENIDTDLDRDPVRFAYSLLDRRADQAPWRYQLHLATQVEGIRAARRTLTAARRGARAVRRAL